MVQNIFQDGCAALAEFMRSDMSRVRNKSAYLSGVISRVKDERLAVHLQPKSQMLLKFVQITTVLRVGLVVYFNLEMCGVCSIVQDGRRRAQVLILRAFVRCVH